MRPQGQFALMLMDASRQNRNGAAHASVVVARLEAGDVQHTRIGERPNQFTRFART
jgi:hypothetical protein